jgi:hypothetical protein
MTERERWVVYPLLFLALGAALRDKVVDRTISKSIRCQELIVVDEEGFGGDPVPLARIGRSSQSASLGEIEVKGLVNIHGILNASQYAYQGVPINLGFQVLPRSVKPVPSAPRRKPNDPAGADSGVPNAAGSGKSQPPAASKSIDDTSPQN